MTSLSLIIPAYNEARRIKRTLDALQTFFQDRPCSEVIVVDDGSTDDTSLIVQRYVDKNPMFRVLRVAHHGKGHAVRSGALEAKYDRVLVMDADLATPLTQLAPLERALDHGQDAAFGVRANNNHDCRVERSALRWLASRIFNGIVRLLLLPKFTDTQCGFKLFRREMLRELCQRQRLLGFGFELELIYLAERLAFKIKEVPVRWSHQAGSKTSLFRDSTRMIADIFYIKRIHAKPRSNSAPSLRS